jgi:hypothetical protein
MVLALLPGIGTQLDKFCPDAGDAADAKLKLLQMAQAGELAQLDADLKLATAQIAVNEAEAASGSLFASSWRPLIGYVCGLGCAWNWIGLPVASFVMSAIGHPVAIYPADLGEMMPLLLGMLGLGGLRTIERVKGVIPPGQ